MNSIIWPQMRGLMEFNPNNLMNSIWSLVPTGFPDHIFFYLTQNSRSQTIISQRSKSYPIPPNHLKIPLRRFQKTTVLVLSPSTPLRRKSSSSTITRLLEAIGKIQIKSWQVFAVLTTQLVRSKSL